MALGRDWAGFWRETPFTGTSLIQAARKGAFERSVTEAWYGEYFARQKRLKPPAHYIGDEKPKKIIGAGERMDASPWLALMGEKKLVTSTD